MPRLMSVRPTASQTRAPEATGTMRRDWSPRKQSDEEPRGSRGYEIARKNDQERTAPSRFA
jgi:hypothetical protein